MRCAGPSCASMARRGVVRPTGLDDQRRAGGAALGYRRAARAEVRLPHVRARGADGRAAVEPPLGDAAPGDLRVVSRLRHVVVQAELETFAIEADGTVAWRIAHSDVVTEAAMVGGRLVLTGYGGGVNALDPATGRSTG